MMNKRNHVDIKFVSDVKILKNLTAKSNFEGWTIFTEILVVVHMKITFIKIDQPTYVGMFILDVSKT